MPEYRTKARWSEALRQEVDDRGEIVVFETDDGIPTGLADRHGNELFRYVKAARMGFVRDA